MRSRRKRVRRKDGSVYRIKTQRDFWKSYRVGTNRWIQGSIDWTKQKVWSVPQIPHGKHEKHGKSPMSR